MPNERDFAEYVESLSKVLGHADRTAPLEGYCRGLMLTSERKSVEPMAALVDPAAVSARHQSMHHFVAASEWSDEKFLAQVRELVLPKLGPIEAWIVDDTGYPKKGNHSVGVARQYCGQLGKQDNCQVAVSVSVANEAASLPIAYQLYLPQEWADDKARRRKAGVPEQIGFATKNQIALAQLRAAREANIPPGVVLADAGYGNDADFRGGVAELGLCYAVGIQSKTTVWTSENRPLPPKKGGKGRPGTLWQRDAEHRPTDVKTLAYTLFARHWKNITWREGERGALRSRFARVRVRGGSSQRSASRGMARHRVAPGRDRAHQVLAVQPARNDSVQADDPPDQAALENRAGLPGAQAGDGLGPLRRAQLARLSSPRQPLHRLVRVPDALSALRKEAR